MYICIHIVVCIDVYILHMCMYNKAFIDHCVRKSTYRISYDSMIHVCIYIHKCMHLCVYVSHLYVQIYILINIHVCLNVFFVLVVSKLWWIWNLDFCSKLWWILKLGIWTWMFVQIPCANDILCDSENRMRVGLLSGSPAWKVESYTVAIIFVSRPGCRQSLHVPNVWSLL